MRLFFKQFVVSFSIFFANTCISYSQEINSIELPLPKGTFTGIISSMTQDPRGYMWFGTSGTGFYRYDGYTVTTYKNQPLNPNSVALNRIESIVADSTGNIWIGTFGQGLDRFDPVTGKFTHYRHNPKDKSSLLNDTVMVVMQDRAGKMFWIGSPAGLSRFDPQTGKFFHYKNDVNNPHSLSHNVVRAIYQDRQNNLWIGTGSAFNGDGTLAGQGGLNKLDQNTGKFTRYLHNPYDSSTLIDNRIRAIFEDSRGVFWVGTAGDGLHTMNRKTGRFERHFFDPNNPEKLSRPPVKKLKGFEYVADHITFINEDGSGAIWIATLQSGLNRYDPETKKIKHFPDFNFGWWSFTSHDGVLWMSTFTSIIFGNQEEPEPVGPNLTAPVKGGIYGSLYQLEPFRKKILYYDMNTGVNSIFEESPGVFWIATEDSGLVRDDRINRTQQKFKYDIKNLKGISNNSVTVIRPGSEGNLWVGTNGGGFELFNKKTQTFTHYQNDRSDKRTIGDNHISSLCVDKEGNLWIGTRTGLEHLNTKTNIITHYPDESKKMGTPEYHIISIFEDREQRLWLATYFNGLFLLNRKTGKFKYYPCGNNTNITSSIYQDTDGVIWVGTKEGLYQYNPSSDSFISFDGINSEASMELVLNILEDAEKNLWITTGTELVKLNPKRTEAIRFGKKQGINPNTLVYGDNGSGATGREIFFGDQSGYYVFQPEKITANTKPPQILLTDFRIDDKTVEFGKNSPIKTPLWITDDINLKYNQNNFSFDFVAMHFSSPKDNRIVYMLENYDLGWRQSTMEQKAYYFNVPPGKYTLKVKATNGNGFWSEKSIQIEITPPWWRTWWANVIFGLLIIGAIWGFIYYRSQKLRSENRILEENVAHRTAQLKQSLEDLKATQSQLIQSEKMASLGELTAGIAHEIQNPLNFVNNFSEVNKELLIEMNEEIEKGNYEEVKVLAKNVGDNEDKINHHGKRADAIVKGMLQHSRTSSGKKELTDINALADEYLRLAYRGLRSKDKSFNATLKAEYDDSIGSINIISQDMGRVILNLVTNAFYAVAEKKKLQSADERIAKAGTEYEPIVSISTKKVGSKVLISIKDNGNGIPQKILDKIFQPFFTTKPTGQGTGLGLSLSYDIIKVHGGELKVETNEGEGAEFVITLPV